MYVYTRQWFHVAVAVAVAAAPPGNQTQPSFFFAFGEIGGSSDLKAQSRTCFVRCLLQG